MVYLDPLWTLRDGSKCTRQRNTNSQMNFASEAKLSCQLFPLAIQSQLVSMPLSGQIMDIGGQVLVQQMERYQLSLTYNASW